MRPRLAKLVGLAAVGALALTPLIAPPAAAAGEGTVTVTIVDDLGAPVIGAVSLINAAGGQPIVLGAEEGPPALPPTVASTITDEVPAGTYGVAVMGGWGGVTCVGLASCSGLVSGAVPTVVPAQAVVVPEGGITPIRVVVATPKLTGTGVVGSPLSVTVPATLTDLGSVIVTMPGGAFAGSPAPTVTWNRGGVPNGATGTTYGVASADAGSTVSATIAYPPAVAYYLNNIPGSVPGIVPATFTTSAVSVSKLTPKLKLDVPKRIKQGKRPTVYINLRYNGAPVAGTVKLTIKGQRTQQGVLRSGLVKFKLPKLKPGKHKVKVAFAGGGAYNPASVTKTVTIQKAKKPKKAKGKKR